MTLTRKQMIKLGLGFIVEAWGLWNFYNTPSFAFVFGVFVAIGCVAPARLKQHALLRIGLYFAILLTAASAARHLNGNPGFPWWAALAIAYSALLIAELDNAGIAARQEKALQP